MSTSFAEGEKMCLSQKMSKKNASKDNKGKKYFLITINLYRRSKIFIKSNDERYEKKFRFY